MFIENIYNDTRLTGEHILSPFKECVLTFGRSFKPWTDDEITFNEKFVGVLKRVADFVFGFFGVIFTSVAVPFGLGVKFHAHKIETKDDSKGEIQEKASSLTPQGTEPQIDKPEEVNLSDLTENLSPEEKQLYQACCDKAVYNPYNYSGFHYLAKSEDIELSLKIKLIKYAISIGANVNDQNNNKKLSPLHYILEHDLVPLDLINAMIEAGADLNIKDENGNSPVAKAIQNAFVYSKEKHLLSIVELFFEKGVDLDCLDPKGELIKKAIDGALSWKDNNLYLTIAKLLIKNGAKIEKADPQGELLNLAIQDAILGFSDEQNYFLTIIKLLIEIGANVEKADPQGELLKEAIKQALVYLDDGIVEYTKLPKLLIENGAKIEVADPNGALLSNAIETALLNANHDIQHIMTFATFLLENGAKIEVADPNGELLKKTIEKAIEHIDNKEYLTIASFLMSNGSKLGEADPQSGLLKKVIEKAIEDMDKIEYLTIAEYLIKNGANTELADPEGKLQKNAIVKALYNPNKPYFTVANFMADTSGIDYKGQYLKEALEKAILWYDHPEFLKTAKLLINNGVKIEDIDPQGALLKEATLKAVEANEAGHYDKKNDYMGIIKFLFENSPASI